MSISRRIMFTTAEALKNRLSGTILFAVEKTIAYYRMHGLRIKWMFADNEFNPLKNDLMERKQVSLDTAAPDEHVPEVERNIRVVKERIRSVLKGMPYKRLPPSFKRELVLSCVTLLNMVPRKAGISQLLSPWTLVTGRAIDYEKQCKVKCGEYSLVHEENKPTNSMKPCYFHKLFGSN